MAGQKRSSSSAFENDPKERMAKWKRRSASLVKMTRELSTLCDTPACIVISCPNNDDAVAGGTTSRFVVWPDVDDGGASLRLLINLYKSKTGSSSSSAKNVWKSSSTTVNAARKKNMPLPTISCNPVMANVDKPTIVNVLAAIDTQMVETQARIDAILERKRAGEDVVISKKSDVILCDEKDNNVIADIAADGNGLVPISMAPTEVGFLNIDKNNNVAEDHCTDDYLIDVSFLDNLAPDNGNEDQWRF